MYKTFRRDDVVLLLIMTAIIGAVLWLMSIVFGGHS